MLPRDAKSLARDLQGKLVFGDPSTVVNGVTTDSRKVRPDAAFIAIRGSRRDGHEFVPAVVEQGTKVVVVQDLPSEYDARATYVQVSEPISALQHLAHAERTTFTGTVVGVTGSNGKTSTKEMLSSVFQTFGPCLSTAGNYNNELGLPLTIIQREPSHRSMVLEMGMRGKGQIQALAKIARPTIGVITNIGHSHIELLGSQLGIAEAKWELIDGLQTLDDVAVLNGDDPFLRHMYNLRIGEGARLPRVLWYSVRESADATASEIETTSVGISFTAEVLGQRTRVSLPTYGTHNVSNALAALLAGASQDFPLDAMARALRTLPPMDGRLHVRQGARDVVVLDDSYNASPLSMKASLDVLDDVAQGRTRVAILGDMYELGFYEEEGHKEVGRYVADKGINHLLTIGEKAKWIHEAAVLAGVDSAIHYNTYSECLKDIHAQVPRGAAVLVKASRGLALEHVVSYLIAD